MTWAVGHNDLEFVKKKLTKGNVNTTDGTNSLLGIAALHAYLPLVKFLLSNNADVNCQFPLSRLVRRLEIGEDGVDKVYEIALILIQNGAQLIFMKRVEKNRFVRFTPLNSIECPRLARKLVPTLKKVIAIREELNRIVMLLLRGHYESTSPLSLLPIELIKRIYDTARYALVVKWASERA